MTLNDIPKGDIVLIDANIVLYAMRHVSDQCIRFLRRCAEGNLSGILASHVLAEIMHRLMMAEARENGWITSGNPARQLSEQPERVKMLVRYEQAIRNLLATGLRFEPIEKEDFIAALRVQRETGLLTNDALLVAVGQRMRVASISSADRLFANVQGIIHYIPEDIEV